LYERISTSFGYEKRFCASRYPSGYRPARAGTAGAGDEEGFLDGLRQVLDVLDEEVVLDHRTGDADRVAFLERILTDGVARHLAGDHHHRDGIHVGGGMPVTALVTPGPDVTSATPTLFDERE
jgi:hypothetical protein